MTKYLLETKEIYRVESEKDAAALIDEAKKSNKYALDKYDCVHKEAKKGGEIIDEWFKVSLTKSFNEEKEPNDSSIDIDYSNSPVVKEYKFD